MYQECEKCGEEYAVREGCDPTKYCDDCAHTVSEEHDKIKVQLEWLWKHCRIVYHGRCEYPLEHSLMHHKDTRELIEEAMRKELEQK